MVIRRHLGQVDLRGRCQQGVITFCRDMIGVDQDIPRAWGRHGHYYLLVRARHSGAPVVIITPGRRGSQLHVEFVVTIGRAVVQSD